MFQTVAGQLSHYGEVSSQQDNGIPLRETNILYGNVVTYPFYKAMLVKLQAYSSKITEPRHSLRLEIEPGAARPRDWRISNHRIAKYGRISPDVDFHKFHLYSFLLSAAIGILMFLVKGNYFVVSTAILLSYFRIL